MDLIEQNLSSLLLAAFVVWIVWKRIVAPKLAGVQSISATDYMKFHDEQHTLLDVRSAGEWRSGHAPGAEHIPLGELSGWGADLATDLPVVVICASGNRSALAATTLARQGMKLVYNFSGGMASWKGAGLPVKTGD